MSDYKQPTHIMTADYQELSKGDRVYVLGYGRDSGYPVCYVSKTVPPENPDEHDYMIATKPDENMVMSIEEVQKRCEDLRESLNFYVGLL